MDIKTLKLVRNGLQELLKSAKLKREEATEHWYDKEAIAKTIKDVECYERVLEIINKKLTPFEK